MTFVGILFAETSRRLNTRRPSAYSNR